MPYYHVILRLADAPEKDRCVFTDLSETELRERFVRPYQRGKNFLSGSEVIEVSTIRKTSIVRTEAPSAETLKGIQEQSKRENDELNRDSRGLVFIGFGRGYHPEDIAEGGGDVTSIFITGPPGEGDKLAVLTAVVNNPTISATISAILGGLILAGLVFWLGWK